MKPEIEIEYCPGCRWLMRAAWTAQELLTTFESDLGGIALRPSEVSGRFVVRVNKKVLWDRKLKERFPEMKELKQLVRDVIAPERDLGHSDTKETGKDA